MSGWGLQDSCKAVEHAGSGAPDITALVRNRQIMAMPPTKPVLPTLVAIELEEMRERRLERRRNFEGVELELERRLDPADDRRDTKPRRDLVLGKAAEQSHVRTR